MYIINRFNYILISPKMVPDDNYLQAIWVGNLRLLQREVKRLNKQVVRPNGKTTDNYNINLARYDWGRFKKFRKFIKWGQNESCNADS